VSAINRRDAIKALGAAPLVGALDWTSDSVDRAARLVGSRPTAGDAEGTSEEPKFFTAHEWRTVRVLVDDVIPRDARSGSATDAKVPEFMDFMLADADASPTSRLAMRGGLAWLDTECRRRFAHPYADATVAQRRAILDDIAWPAKARPEMRHGAAFFSRFRDLTASGFFSSAMGYGDLQYQGNTFVPVWTGCPQAALDKLGVSYDLMSRREAP